MNDPREAHRQEILEALLEAARSEDEERFAAFNEEWERIDIPDEDHEYCIRFAGMPRLIHVEEFCEHCGETWTADGIAFGDPTPGMDVLMHMTYGCPNAEECLCWSDLENDAIDTIFNYPFCQVCWDPSPYCECDIITLGSCASIELRDRIAQAERIEREEFGGEDAQE